MQFEIPRRVRGTSRFRKKDLSRPRPRPRLDPSIPRSSNSLGSLFVSPIQKKNDVHYVVTIEEGRAVSKSPH